MAVTAEEGAYVAFHSGTLKTPQSVEGMRESCELADGNPLHLAHINSYTRGLDRPGVIEAEEAIEILGQHPNIWSESYLAPINGNSGKCANGVPESVATQKNLQRGGFPATDAGMIDAIRAGWAMVHVLKDGVHVLTGGEEGLAAWKTAGSDIGISFFANPPEPRLHLATAKRPMAASPSMRWPPMAAASPATICVRAGWRWCISMRSRSTSSSKRPASARRGRSASLRARGISGSARTPTSR